MMILLSFHIISSYAKKNMIDLYRHQLTNQTKQPTNLSNLSNLSNIGENQPTNQLTN